jgi:DNA-cytosine methyltransferase
MRYVSLFAGIEAASQAWHHMGWEPVAFADIDAFPSAVLAHHYPDVPNLGNVEEVDWNEYRGKAELVVGGSPCQSFSVAGRRLGMDDPRGNLALEFIRAVAEIQPTWFVFENVPGLLSSDEGRDFGIFLGQVAEIGYGFAYRVLDSQFFGVPQRRRRVFVVGHIGNDWRSAASVLFESESLQGHSKESKSQGQEITNYIGRSTSSQSESGRGIEIFRKSRRAQSETDHETWVEDEVTNTLNTFDLGDTRTTQIIGERDNPLAPKIAGNLDTNCGAGKLSHHTAISNHLIPEETEPIAFEQNQRSEVRETEVAGPVKAEKGSNNQTFIAQNWDGEDKTGTLTTNQTSYNPTKDNFMAIVEAKNWDGKDKTGTLTTRSMQQFMPDKDNFMAVVEPQDESKIFDSWGLNKNPKNVSPTLRSSVTYTSGDPIVTEPEIFSETNPTGKTDVSPTLNARQVGSTGEPILTEKTTLHDVDSGKESDVARTLVGDHQSRIADTSSVAVEQTVHSFDSTFGANSNVFEDVSPTLKVGTNSGAGSPPAISQETIGFDWKNAAQTNFDEKNSGAPVTAEGGLAVKQTSMAVRRLTPVECERLQGFPDNYTQIAWKGKAPEDCPDGPRYKALGNSMAVPVMRWIGEGIQMVDDLVKGLDERADSKTTEQKSLFDF